MPRAHRGSDRRDPELGRSGRDHAAAARQPLGRGKRPRRPLRRHALRERRPCPGPRDARPRSGPASRSRASRGRDHRLRSPPRRVGRARPRRSARRTSASFPTSRGSCFRDSLSAADIHYLGLVRGLAGYVVPSRLNGILSAGRPVIVAADSESEPVAVVEAAGCGVAVPPGDAGSTRSRDSDAPTPASVDLAELGARRAQLDRAAQGEGIAATASYSRARRSVLLGPSGAREPGMIARYGAGGGRDPRRARTASPPGTC